MTSSPSPLHLLVRSLRRHAPLSADDEAAILDLHGTLRVLPSAGYIVREGERPQNCGFVLRGYAFRQKLTSEGARQIVGLHIPGDALDFQMLYLDMADHSIQALTEAELLVVPRVEVERLIQERPAVAHAVIVNILTEASITREWLLNIGRRDARTRLAHLLCEFALRLDLQGLSDGGSYELPMTQEQVGDALGLTSVHVNRTLRVLEAEGALTRQGRRIQFDDVAHVRRIADFSTRYLHLAKQVAA